MHNPFAMLSKLFLKRKYSQEINWEPYPYVDWDIVVKFGTRICEKARLEMDRVKSRPNGAQYPDFPEIRCPICAGDSNNKEAKQYLGYCGKLAPAAQELQTDDDRIAFKTIDDEVKKLLKIEKKRKKTQKRKFDLCPICSRQLHKPKYGSDESWKRQRKDMLWRGFAAGRIEELGRSEL
jgi:hypothetical protein